MTVNTEKNQIFDIIDENKLKNIILYGASSRGIRVFYNLIDKGFPQKQIIFCDSNSKLWNTYVCNTKIISPEELKSFPKNTCIIISTNMHYDVIPDLKKLGFAKIYYFNSLLYVEQMYEKYNSEFLDILQKIGDNRNLDNEENYTLYSCLKATKNLSGDIAEFGVYRGGTAKLICEVKSNKNLYLFDTFEGLPKTSDNDLLVKAGWLDNTSVESVKNYLKDYKNVFYVKGFFPETTESVFDKKFSFIHLDTDLYQSTLDGLKFFWPRMVTGGRIVSHDYNAISIPGVKKAFFEFFKNSPEKLIEIADTQIMVTK
jgi:O-methyltransferase